MGTTCINLSDEEKLKFKNDLGKFGINVKDLSDAELNSAVTKLVSVGTLKDNYIINKENVSLVAQEISNQRTIRKNLQDEKKAEEENRNKIGQARIITNRYTNKQAPYKNPNVLFVYSENGQAYAEVAKLKGEEFPPITGLLKPEGGVSLNVAEHGSTYSNFRTNSNFQNGEEEGKSVGNVEDLSENATGIVVKKNAQNEKGEFISTKSSKEDKASSIFTTSNEDMAAFVQINQKVLNNIRDLCESGKFEEVQLLEEFALQSAGLPRILADQLAKMIRDTLGVIATVERSTYGNDLYGVRLSVGTVNNTKSDLEKKANALQEEAMQALEAERPIDIALLAREKGGKLLMKVFPNIPERHTRVQLLAQMFADQLQVEIENTLDELENREELTASEGETLAILKNGTEVDKIKEIIRYNDGSAMSTSYRILNNIKTLLTSVGKMVDVVEETDKQGNKTVRREIKEENREWVIENIYENTDTIFGRELALEQSVSPVSKATVQKRAEKLMRLGEKILNTEGLFEGLLEEASDIIEQQLGIRLSMDKSTIVDIESEEEDMENDEVPENRSGLYLIKQKFLDPKTTLSHRMKSYLSHQYKVASVKNVNGKKVPVYEHTDLGLRIPLNSGVVYYNLIKRFSEMTCSEDFLPMVEKMTQEYPWFIETADRIMNDSDFRNEFYRCFRQVAVVYSVITPSFKIQFKNRGLDATAIKDMVTRNYEGALVLSSSSLYDEEGKINLNNVRVLRELTYINSKDEKYEKYDKDKKEARKGKSVMTAKDAESAITAEYYPIAFVLNTLDPYSRNLNVANAKRAYDILKNHKIASLDNILRSIGVDTRDFDWTNLLPDIDWDSISDYKQLNDAWRSASRNDIFTILNNFKEIVNARTGVSAKTESLILEYENKYLSIGNKLTGLTEGYTQASFFWNGSTYYAYTHPSYTDILVGTLNNVKDERGVTRGNEFLERNFLRFDFQKNSPLLNTMRNDLEVRENFFKHQVIGVGDETIGKVTDLQFLETIIAGFFSGKVINSEEGGRKYFSYYRNPLYSDTEALEMFRLPRYTGEGWKDTVEDKLTHILEAEIDRILAYEDPESRGGVTVDFYNDRKGNAGKFCFFPQLNKRKKEIFDDLSSMSSDISTYAEKKHAYLKRIVSELMADNFKSFLEGDLVGSDTVKLYLYDVIHKRIQEVENKLNKQGEYDSEQDSIDDEGQFIDDAGLVYDEDGNVIPQEQVNEKKSKEEKLKEEQKIREVEQYLEEFYYNDYYMQAELILLLGGDLAYFKNIRDFIKRNKQAYASGEKIYALDDDGNPMFQNVLYLQDKQATSTTFLSIKELFDKTGMSARDKEIALSMLRPFTDITSTDGQGLRSLESFKKIYKAMGGKWTPQIEEAFDKIQRGELDLSCWSNLLEAIKPFLFSYEAKTINSRNEKVMVQHKNSEYLISALFGTLNMALNKSPELIALQQFMKLHNIDAIQFRSCVKEGCFNPLNLNYDEYAFKKDHPDITYKEWRKNLIKELENGKLTQKQFNDQIAKYSFRLTWHDNNKIKRTIRERGNKSKEQYLEALRALQSDPKNAGNALLALEIQMAEIGEEDALHVIPYEDYMIVQPTSDHLTDHQALHGSQSKNVLSADLTDDFFCDLQVGSSTVRLNKEEFLKHYNTLFVDKSLQSFYKIGNKFGDIKSVKSLLDSQMEGNPKYGGEVKKAFEVDEEKQRFVMPMNTPTINNKAQDLLLSQFKNNIQKTYTDGGNVVLVSNFGLSHGFHDELHVHYKYVKDEEGNKVKVVDYIPCYMPAYTADWYKDYIDEKTGEVDFKLMEDTLKKELGKEAGEEEFRKLTEIIGYRIPTESKYSMMPIRIIGFMPPQAGGTIMLPSDIITMSGTDFDIDKLFLMRRSFTKEIASGKLGIKFKNWLVEKYGEEALNDKSNIKTLKALSYVQYNEKNEIIGYTKRKQGFTASDVRRQYNSNAKFREFMDDPDKKAKALRNRPIYRVIEPKIKRKDGVIDLDETLKFEGVEESLADKMRNNMIVNIYWSVLTSPEGSRQMMKPATYDHVKIASDICIILNDPNMLKEFLTTFKEEVDKYDSFYDFLNHLGDTDEKTLEKLEDFVEQYAGSDNPLDVSFYISSHRNLMDGNDLIGGFAVNSSRHQKLQLCTEIVDGEKHQIVQLAKPLNIRIPGRGEFTLSEIDPLISPITGRLIGEICEEFQAASPDNGKDPRLGYMGVSMNTLKEVCLMISLGLEEKTIGFLLSCKPLVSIGYDFIKENKQEEKKFNKEFKLEDYVCDLGELSNMLVALKLDPDKRNSMTLEEREMLKGYAKWWTSLLNAAEDLNKSSVYIRADSPNGALPVSVAEAIQQEIKVQELKHQEKYGVSTKWGSRDFEVKGLTRVIDLDLKAGDYTREQLREKIMESRLPRLQAAYTLGIKSATELVKQYLPELSEVVITAVKRLGFLTDRNMKTKGNLKTVRSFLNELTTYMLSGYDRLKEEDLADTRNYYIHDFPMHFRNFLDAMDKDKRLIHKDIANHPLFKMLSNISGKGIKFHNVGGKVSVDSRQTYMEGLDFANSHMDAATREFATDLFLYAFFENGLNFGHSNYGIFFSPDFIKEVPGLLDYLHDSNAELTSGNSDYMANYIDQYLMNHPHLIPYIYASNDDFIDEGNTLQFQHLSDTKLALLYGVDQSTDTKTYKRFIRATRKIVTKDKDGEEKEEYKTSIYKFANDSNGAITYVKVNHNNLPISSPFYDDSKSSEEIDWTGLKEKGPVISTKAQQKIAQKNAKDIAMADGNDNNEETNAAIPDKQTVKTLKDQDGYDVSSLQDKDYSVDAIQQKDYSVKEIQTTNEGDFVPPEIFFGNEGGVTPKEVEIKNLSDVKEIEDPQKQICHSQQVNK